MSSLSRWYYTDPLTIWPVTKDAAGQLIPGVPYLIPCGWELGGKVQTDVNGVQFTPKSTYYFELPDGDPNLPKLTWYAKHGDYTLQPDPFIAKAEIIKAIGGWGMTAFGITEIPDWYIAT